MAAMFPDSGSYMVHWHQVDGQWKIASLVVNGMKPLPGMEAMMAPAPSSSPCGTETRDLARKSGEVPCRFPARRLLK
jgi:hypothetical protein